LRLVFFAVFLAAGLACCCDALGRWRGRRANLRGPAQTTPARAMTKRGEPELTEGGSQSNNSKVIAVFETRTTSQRAILHGAMAHRKGKSIPIGSSIYYRFRYGRNVSAFKVSVAALRGAAHPGSPGMPAAQNSDPLQQGGIRVAGQSGEPVPPPCVTRKKPSRSFPLSSRTISRFTEEPAPSRRFRFFCFFFFFSKESTLPITPRPLN